MNNGCIYLTAILFVFLLNAFGVEPEPQLEAVDKDATIDQNNTQLSFEDSVSDLDLTQYINPTNHYFCNPNEVHQTLVQLIDRGCHWYNINAIELADNEQSPLLLQMRYAYLWMKVIHQFRENKKLPFLLNALKLITKQDVSFAQIFFQWIGVVDPSEQMQWIESFCKIFAQLLPHAQITPEVFNQLMGELLGSEADQFMALNQEVVREHLDQYNVPLIEIEEERGVGVTNTLMPTRQAVVTWLQNIWQNPNFRVVGTAVAVFCLMQTKDSH